MAEKFFDLSSNEKSKILRAMSVQLDRSPTVLEKDVWVCWVLETLFTMPGRLPMAFKGGTSLSKVFGAISRFSEDVDITLDYRGLDGKFDPFAEGVSKNKLKNFSENLKSFVSTHVHGMVVPHFHAAIDQQFDSNSLRIEVSDDGEQMRIHYPTTLETPGDYVGNSVLVEFGGRNITEPNEQHEIKPDIADHVADLEFPRSLVSVLAPARTFWEKATLMHVECQRTEYRATAARLSRHWYDLSMLANQSIGKAAISNRDMLADVVKHKKVFYSASYANYDACLIGQLKLIPNEDSLKTLREDFQRMIDAEMFFGERPDFDEIIDSLRTLETEVNDNFRQP